LTGSLPFAAAGAARTSPLNCRTIHSATSVLDRLSQAAGLAAPPRFGSDAHKYWRRRSYRERGTSFQILALSRTPPLRRVMRP
jgi:hypothetical protein